MRMGLFHHHGRRTIHGGVLLITWLVQGFSANYDTIGFTADLCSIPRTVTSPDGRGLYGCYFGKIVKSKMRIAKTSSALQNGLFPLFTLAYQYGI